MNNFSSVLSFPGFSFAFDGKEFSPSVKTFHHPLFIYKVTIYKVTIHD